MLICHMMLWRIKVWKCFQQLSSSEFGFDSEGGNLQKETKKKKRDALTGRPNYGSEVHCVQLDHQGSLSILLKHLNTSIWSVTLACCPVKSELREYGSFLFNRMIPTLQMDWLATLQLWEDARDSVQDWHTLHCFISHTWVVHPVSMLTDATY